jgi:hypothetical protein
MLVAYVSDENYLALADVQVEFQRGAGSAVAVRSTPRGAVYVELDEGEYNVTLAREGFGSKRVTMQLSRTAPYQFRLLSNTLLGYMWPRWVKAGEASEYRIHSPTECRVSL